MDKNAENCTKILSSGNHEIKLPFSDEPDFLDNKRQALKMFVVNDSKFKSDVEYFQEYIKCIYVMISNDFVEKVPKEELETKPGKKWYLVHHGVRHKRKGKLRVVFNCSLKYQGVSLNDKLLQGPDLTNNLFGVLTRFRKHKIALNGDIEKMFYQVKVPKEDSNFMRFLKIFLVWWWQIKHCWI